MPIIPQVTKKDADKFHLSKTSLLGKRILPKLGSVMNHDLRKKVVEKFSQYGKKDVTVEQIARDIRTITKKFSNDVKPDVVEKKFLKVAKNYVAKSRIRNLYLRQMETADENLGALDHSQYKIGINVARVGKQSNFAGGSVMTSSAQRVEGENNNLAGISALGNKLNSGFAGGSSRLGNFAGGSAKPGFALQSKKKIL